jgi:serine/threonine-protein kinase
LFALGIVLYEVLSGERLFHSDSEAQTIMRVARAEIPDVRAIRPDLPAAVAAVLGRALARDPADRYQTAAEFARDVRHQLLSAAPDELEASFRDMVRRSVAEDSFVEYAGRLPDLAHELTAAPLALAGLGATATRRHARDESSATTRRPAVATRARQTRLVLFLVVVGVTLLAALASGAVLFGLGPQRGGAATGDQPVKVIVENRGAPPPAGGAETEPAAATPGGAARGLPSPVADAAPLADASVPGADAGVDISKTPRTSLTPLDGRRVSRTLMSRRRALLACFEQGSAGAEQVKNVVIRLEVGGDGAVRWAKVEPASVDGTRMGKCLAAVASTTRFPRHPESALVFRVPIAVSQE